MRVLALKYAFQSLLILLKDNFAFSKGFRATSRKLVSSAIPHELPGGFFHVKYYRFARPCYAAFEDVFLKGLENPNFNMSVKSLEVEMNKNACSYFVSILVPIEFILRLHRCLLLAANFGQFVKQKTALQRRFQIFARFAKNKNR